MTDSDFDVNGHINYIAGTFDVVFDNDSVFHPVDNPRIEREISVVPMSHGIFNIKQCIIITFQKLI